MYFPNLGDLSILGKTDSNSFLKSTVDWCEINYNTSDILAEFWNSISGIAIMISAITFRIKYKDLFVDSINNIRNNNNEYITQVNGINNIFILLCITSIGTILFHGTLLFPFQLLDEIPMVLIAIEYLKILINLKIFNIAFSSIVNRFFNKIINICFNSIFYIPIIYFISHTLQILTFHIILKILEVSIVYIIYVYNLYYNEFVYQYIYTRYSSNQLVLIHKLCLYKNYKEDMKKSLHIGKNVYILSITFWVLEKFFCDKLEWIQLHAWWHIFSSVGIFYLNRSIRCKILIDSL